MLASIVPKKTGKHSISYDWIQLVYDQQYEICLVATWVTTSYAVQHTACVA